MPKNHNDTGREYLRVSQDRAGRGRSVEEQHADNRKAAEERGVRLGEPYAEAGSASASRYARRAREVFDRLLADLRGGRFEAGELWLWESSRGSRRVSEWVELVELCEVRSVRIFVTSHGRLYDPANPRDRRSLLEDAVDSEYETAKGSARTRRAHAALAAAGRPNGRAPYGYHRGYDPQTREGRQAIEPAEAAVVREVFGRLACGHPLQAIAVDLNQRGLRRRDGREWTRQALRDMAVRESYAGRRVHQHRDSQGRKVGPVTVTPGRWAPIVAPELFDRVRRLLTAPERKTTRPGRGVHLLSFIGVCDVCDGPLAAAYRRGHWSYWCHRSGHVLVPRDDLDREVEDVLLAYLARPDIAERLRAAVASGPDLDAARAELEAVRGRLADLYEQVSTGGLSPAALAAIEPRVLADASAAEVRTRELSAPPALAGLITPGPGVQRRWAGLPMSARREVARIVLAPDLLGELRVTRGRPGRSVPVAERVVWRRTG